MWAGPDRWAFFPHICLAFSPRADRTWGLLVPPREALWPLVLKAFSSGSIVIWWAFLVCKGGRRGQNLDPLGAGPDAKLCVWNLSDLVGLVTWKGNRSQDEVTVPVGSHSWSVVELGAQPRRVSCSEMPAYVSLYALPTCLPSSSPWLSLLCHEQSH